MSLYTTTKIIPFEDISKKILKRISNIANIAEQSDFEASKRLGACLEIKGSCFLRP